MHAKCLFNRMCAYCTLYKADYTESEKGGTHMETIKNSLIEIILILLCTCTVFISKVPETFGNWLLNTVVLVVMGICLIRIALHMLNK